MPDSPNNYIDLKSAAKYFPRSNGKSTCITTVFRWMKNGVPVGDRTVRLRHAPIAKRIWTTPEWIHEFVCELEQKYRENPTSEPTTRKRTDAQRRAAIERAEQELASAGM